MRTPTGAFLLACALCCAFLLAGCGPGGDGAEAGAGATLLLLRAGDRGPDPFTDSTAVATALPPSAPRTPGAAGAAARVSAGPRSLSGATPGLYGGRERSGSCDIGRQVGHLTRDRARGRAFARVAGVPAASVPDYVRALTPMVLRADTRVTGHGYRAGRVTAYQSVLQAGTAVLVDDRGLPRVRCACGNPLRPPRAPRSTPATRGTPWPGYRPGAVVVVTPAPRVITGFTIVDSAARTWIERRPGHDVRHDRVLPPPVWAPRPPADPEPPPTAPDGTGTAPDRHRPPPPGPASPADPGLPVEPPAPPAGESEPPSEEPAPDAPGDPGPADTVDPPDPEDREAPVDPGHPEDPGDSGEAAGPDTVPDLPDPPDGAGLIPDDRAAGRIPRGSGDVRGH
ncbi:DUF6777 domain-containing protein [Streptomyces sp. bgisy032]|uniref:DUF6777 domain-containing protein n=1 Tax=Streptomyces sp. bgisy032 TaxID=3413773 RepID=UPI003D75D6F6